MQLILREDVEHLGKTGEMVNVADGYGRNFLLPKKKAILATDKNVKALEHERRVIAEKARKLLDAATSLARKIAGVSITVEKQAGEEDKLFGSVTSMDIHDALVKEGIDVDKKRIHLDEPIKRLGEFAIPVRLEQGVTAELKLFVVKAAE